ncbi:hypothetical protein ACHAXT_004245 [Thalassiosira profunda]
MADVPFSPLDWLCPHCNRRQSQSLKLMLIRGTCRHDLCCIPQIASETRDEDTPTAGGWVEVPCPIDGCRGKFHMHIDEKGVGEDTKTYLSSISKVKRERKGDQNDNKEVEVIDLCDDGSNDDGSDAKSHTQPKRPRRAVKREEEATPERITSMKMAKKEEVTPERTTSIKVEKGGKKNVVSPSSDCSNLKPVFDIGDAVVAAWWDPKTDQKRKKEASWHQGKVKAFNEVGHSRYGPIRLYDIRYDDGDELSAVNDHWVFPKEEYELEMKLDKKKAKPIGVRPVYDLQSSDQWARKVGWHEVTIGREARPFSRLSDAMKAHDDEVVRLNGAHTKEPNLNRNLLKGLAQKGTKIKEERVAVQEKTTLKLELKEETDDDSRFSEGEEQFVEPPQGKTPASKANFWDQVADPVDFSQHAFMTKPMFHLNTGIDGKVKHQNLFFGPFLREGVATPGFAEVPPEIAQKVPNSTYEDIRDAINKATYDGQGMRSSCQVALWLKDATVGSFVVMRHEFPECPFTPSRLKPNGKYIGPVFVIGVITQKILPGSTHEKRIKNKHMGEYKRHNTHTFSLVDWRWMGTKATLQEETKRYINSVCQPTINRMCQDPRKEYKCAATGETYTGESVRRDLWENATMPIRPEEFPDVFDIAAISHYDSD